MTPKDHISRKLHSVAMQQSCHGNSESYILLLFIALSLCSYFLVATRTLKFNLWHCILFFYILCSDEEGEFSLDYDTRHTEWEEDEGETGPPGGYFVIINENKINIVPFFFIIHIIFDKI